MEYRQLPQQKAQNHPDTFKQCLQKVKNKTLLQTSSQSPQQCRKSGKDHDISKNSTERTNLKLKFNTSYDNLRCFISEKKTERHRSVSTRLSKQAKSEICIYYQKHNLKLFKEQIKIEQFKSEKEVHQVIKAEEKLDDEQSDLSQVFLNEIVHSIEQKGIDYDWKDIQEIKSEDFHSQNNQEDQQIEEIFDAFSDLKRSKRASLQQKTAENSFIIKQQANFENHENTNEEVERGQYFENGSNYNLSFDNNYEKNYSFASTMQPYSKLYYPISVYSLENDLISDTAHGFRQMPSSMYQSCEFIIRPEGLGNDPRTTLMIKNIPNKYTIHFLSEQIDQGFGNYYDFLYLPCDTKSGANQGYGFINFIDLDAIKRFYEKFHGKKWKRFKSEKICNLTYARLQGINSLIEHFQNSKVLNHKQKKYQPIIKSLSSIHHLIKRQQNNQDQ